MNEPENSVPPRSARPQLFNAPASTKRSAQRNPDFGPSILATIDGGQGRFASPRNRKPGRRMWWAGFIALAVAAAYAGVKFNGQGSAPTPTPAPEVVVAATPRAVVKAVEPIAEPTSQAAPSQGVAAIETVAVPPPPAASADTQTAKDAPSPGSIQQALDRPEPATVAPKSEKPSAKQVQAVKKAPATPPVSKSNPSTGSAARTTDTDAELLAAMLPHLKRSPNVPTSPAYEKSCGQFSGAASTECRAKFCKEKQGRDTACPVTQPAPP